VQTLDDNSPRPVTPPGVISLGVTADGKYLAGRDESKKWVLYPIAGGQPIPLPKWPADDFPINHTTDNHSFFVERGDLPVEVYRLDFVSGTRQLVRRLQPADTTGVERMTMVLMTPDGKSCVFSGVRRVSTLFVVSGLK
jgi:hypothetical protein